jgi:hypothetical protein
MELKREHVEWLSIIRYQSDLAENQAKDPEPLNAISISTIHDAVESMLGLIAEVHQVATPNKDFAKLFDAVSNHIKTQSCDLSGHRSAMIALNNARVAFKHHGNQSNKQTIDRHIANGLNFLADAAEQGLNTPFAEVSLLGFVRDPKVREYIYRADNCSSGAVEDRMLAFEYLRLGFETLAQGYQQSKSYYPGRPLITTKPSFLPSVFEIRNHGGKVGEKAFKWLENLDSWVRILVLGIDVQEYTFFLAYTPELTMTLNGGGIFSLAFRTRSFRRRLPPLSPVRGGVGYSAGTQRLRLRRLERTPVVAGRSAKHREGKPCDDPRRERAVDPA